MSTKKVKDLLNLVEIDPLKDFRITHNEYDIVIKEGETASIPQKFLQNMLTEGVIKKLPKEG